METTHLSNELRDTRETRFKHKMQLEGDSKNEETLAARHELDSKLVTKLIEKKKAELAVVMANQKK
jgi:hypothetical protein